VPCFALGEECGFVFFELARGLADSWHVVTALWCFVPFSPFARLLSVIEEMCHCFYGIADETEVKHMVSDIVRRYINPDKTFETLFPNWPAG